MTTEAQKRAHEKLAEARKAAGKRPLTIWVTEAAREALRAGAKVHGSMERAAEFALLSLASVPAPKPPKPSPVSRGKLDTAAESVSFGPIDALTGKPLDRRGPIPKAEKSKR